MNTIKRLFTWLRPVIVVDKNFLSILKPGETGLILIKRRLHPREREEMRATLVAAGLVGERRVIVMDGADQVEIVKRQNPGSSEAPAPQQPAGGIALPDSMDFASISAAEFENLESRTFAEHEMVGVFKSDSGAAPNRSSSLGEPAKDRSASSVSAMTPDDENEKWRLFVRQETRDDVQANESKWVGGIPPSKHSTDESGAPLKSTPDDEYAAALAAVGMTTPLLSRIEAACVTLGHGAKETGYRTLHALMHPDKDFEPPRCNREAAAIIFSVLAALLEDAPPERIAQISRTINERSFSSAGLL